MDRYYAVNYKGEVVAESDNRIELETKLSDYGYDEKRIEEEEVEIIEGR